VFEILIDHRFDLLLPAGFPNLPPKINFVLEGTDRDLPPMNPNLHPGGTG
jgi:hypothetical protein